MTAVPGELDGDVGGLLAALHREYPGVLSWRGNATGSWWALVGDRLIEARDVRALARRISELCPYRRPRG